MLGCYIKSRHHSVLEITAWAQKRFQNLLPVITVHCAINHFKLKLHHIKGKPYVKIIQKNNRLFWAKAHLKWTEAKWKTDSNF